LRIRNEGGQVTADLTVRPVLDTPSEEDVPQLFVVILKEVETPAALPSSEGAVSSDVQGRIAELESQLAAKDEYLQSALQETDSANEALKTTNEELQSVNEELQSTNEELETSKEELQAVNEELITVNAELQIRVADLSRVNNDMNNLLSGTGVATLFVDLKSRITRFTPDALQLINLIPSDVGRPVEHVVSNLVGYDGLSADIGTVLDRLIPVERQVETKTGAWFLMRIRPYRTLENAIEGAVITFVDVTERKRIEDELRRSRDVPGG
jgi:two-component system CheB/CheR fusion protein